MIKGSTLLIGALAAGAACLFYTEVWDRVPVCMPTTDKEGFIHNSCITLRTDDVQATLKFEPTAFVRNSRDLRRIEKHNQDLIRQGKTPPITLP
jgi:hypothetical protein